MITYEKRWGDTMYNEEQKLKYLETIESESSRKSAYNSLNKFSDIEHAKNRDISTWDSNEIYEAINNIHSLDFDTIKRYLACVSSYIAFSRANTHDENYYADGFKLDVSNVDLTHAIRENIIQSPDLLKKEISRVRELDQGHYIVAAACFAWLGIDIQTMPMINDTAVNFDKKSIVDTECNIEIYNIDDTLMYILKVYWETTEAIRWHKHACRVYPIYNGKFLHVFSGINSKKSASQIRYGSIRNEFMNLSNDSINNDGKPGKLEYKNIRRSGMLYKLFQLESNGVDITDRKSDELMKTIYSNPGKDYDIRSLYRQYKRAFNLE